MVGTVRDWPRMGVVVVTYSAEDFIVPCLESVVAAGYPDMKIVVVDNQSPDATAETIRTWAAGRGAPRRATVGEIGSGVEPALIDLEERPAGAVYRPPQETVTLVHSGANLGFAGGVNLGLRTLLADPGIEVFWILNPDTVTRPEAPFAFARKARQMGRFAVLGGRVLFYDDPARIHADTGRLHTLAGTAISVNRGRIAAETPMAREEDTDFIPGISMVASRAFIERAGLMEERYFLYFEEIDWQLRRGDLPFGLEKEACVLHRGGGSIGSGNLSRRASPFSIYFTTRNLLPFVARWQPWKLPAAYAMAWVRLFRHWGLEPGCLSAFLRGLHRMGPPEEVRRRLPDAVWAGILRPAARSTGAAGTS